MAPDTRRILVLGSKGQVGRALPAALARLGEVVALDRAAADLAVPESLRSVIRRAQPSAIVNAAAYTAVDRAESEPKIARAVNATAAGVIAEEARALGACVVYYSTDYVFDGLKSAPYVETDRPNPLSVYGASKLDGERAVVAANPRHLILRTSWVISAHGTNFVRTMLRLAAERHALQVVADQRGVPTSARLLAETTAILLDAMIDAPAGDRRWGVYHLVPAGETTWHELARYVIERARVSGFPFRATPENVAAIATAAYPTAAKRPANSRLDTTKLRETFGINLPEWRAGVDEALDQLAPTRA